MIPVIDLFAGPGGLGEGFCSYKNHKIFNIILSVEKEKFACETLILRSFFHQFKKKPNDYYEYLKGKIDKEVLFNKYADEYKKAQDIVMNLEMGVGDNSNKVSKKINEVIKKNSQWVLLGGPPCQAYSLAGRSKLTKLKGKKLFEKDSRHTLYKEYLKIISDHSPSVFIMENVKGLISSKINDNNILDSILKDLSSPDKVFQNKQMKEYDLFSLNQNTDLFDNKNFLIDCSKHGVPQKRERLFIIGIRKNLNIKKIQSLKIEKEIPIQDVLSNLPKLRSIISKEVDSFEKWLNIFNSFLNNKNFSITNELEAAKKINNLGSPYFKKKLSKTPYKSEWFDDPRIEGVINHETRKYLSEDIKRYIYSTLFAKKYHYSPKINDFPKKLYPKHKNLYLDSKIIFNDRFRVQLKNKPATTITSHISKDGHYYIHYDTSQARSLTVREAARIQTFPDNYLFEGNKTQQYIQVGNAVPPLMAKKIASIIFSDIFKKL